MDKGTKRMFGSKEASKPKQTEWLKDFKIWSVDGKNYNKK